MRLASVLGLALLCLLLLCPGPSSPRAGRQDPDLARALRGLVVRGGVLVELPSGQGLELNPGLPLVPASTIKIATALAALDVLGPDYRFTTEFYLHGDSLVVRGQGDPMLVSEDIAEIMAALAAQGISEISGIRIDDSAFALEHGPPGQDHTDNPYDAGNGAVSLNFNTVKLRVRGNGRVESAEPQTPYVPLMGLLARGRRPGTYRVNIAPYPPWRLSAELVRALAARAGIVCTGALERGPLPPGARLIHRHEGRPLTEIIRLFMRSSSNFMANQVFLACGAARYGPPATWDKARRAAAGALKRRIGPLSREITMVDGSGLSRGNRATARAMAALLRAFRPHALLLPKKHGARLKSGTMEGIYCYAGYLGPKRRMAVILLNQDRNTRDQVLKVLSRLR